MQRDYIEKRNMCLVLQKFIKETDAGILAELPNFEVVFERFEDKIRQLEQASMKQSANRKGIRKKKDDCKVAMVVAATDVAGRIRAYAAVHGDVVLAKEVGFGYAVLFKKSDGICCDLCGFVYKKGTTLLNELAAYGVTEAMLADLLAKVTLFRGQVAKPRLGIIERRQATLAIKRLMKELDADLAVMDVLVRMVRFSNKEFYSLYFSFRKIVRIGYRAVAIDGTVVDAEGMPVANVDVVVLNTKFVRKTSEHGGFEVRRLKSAVYRVCFKKVGFVDAFVDVAVTSGMRNEVKVVMERSLSASA